GKIEVPVFKRPKVGILITGNELVDVDKKPKRGQIRNSNGYALLNQVHETGCTPNLLGIAGDTLDSLREMIASGLNYDVLLITGGVSMGEFDLVEDVFEELGVEVFYDKVNIKPGKPTVFGRKDGTLVFGLPGNPVSASTIFDVVVRCVLRQIAGFPAVENIVIQAKLTEDFQSRTRRENYAPAQTFIIDKRLRVSPIHSKGSADVLAYSKSNSYLIMPIDLDQLHQGDEVDVLLREEFWRAGKVHYL
ncbi:molybdopterin molybdotransferase MoeA, partial [bacterium]|nr:molybdopterin molybdotransferase MoeA [bacterium]